MNLFTNLLTLSNKEQNSNIVNANIKDCKGMCDIENNSFDEHLDELLLEAQKETLVIENEMDYSKLEIDNKTETLKTEDNDEINFDFTGTTIEEGDECSETVDIFNSVHSERCDVTILSEIHPIYRDSNIKVKNDEIGEKQIDSVKCSLSSNLKISVSDLIQKKSDQPMNTKEVMDNTYDQENTLDELSTDIEFSNLDLDLDFNKLNSNEQSDGEIQTNDIEANQKEIFKQIKEGLKGNSGTRSMQIMLKPHQLGKVNLNLKFFNNAMHINVFVENGSVEEILKQNIEQIISTVNPTGTINIGSVTVSKVGDLLEESFKKDIEKVEGFEKYKGNPFVHKISKFNYYR